MILAIIHEYYSLSPICHNRKSLSTYIETFLSNVMVTASANAEDRGNDPAVQTR